jgi:hypothetical protein
MNTYINQTFDALRIKSGKNFRDLNFVKCHFIGCSIAIAGNLKRQSLVSNIQMVNCEQHGCSIGPAKLEDVLIDGLKTNGLLQAWGTLLRNVTLKGKIDRIMISYFFDGLATEKEQKAYDVISAMYYSQVDWALDIREALFLEADLRGVPGHLILRDPDSQFLIRREIALKNEWKKLDLSKSGMDFFIQFFLDNGRESEVLVAAKRNPKYRIKRDDLLKLRDIGVVE